MPQRAHTAYAHTARVLYLGSCIISSDKQRAACTYGSCIISSDKPMHDETNSISVYRNITAMDNNKFRNDLEIELSTLCHDLTSSSVTPEILDNSFNKLVDCITRVIDKHAPLQKASRSQ